TLPLHDALPIFDHGLLDALVGPEGLVEDVARADVAQLGAHERPALAGLDVLELDDLEETLRQVERHAGLEVVGRGGSHAASAPGAGVTTGWGPWAPASACGTPRR